MLDPFFGKSDAAIVFLDMSNALRRVNHTQHASSLLCETQQPQHRNHN